MALLADEMPGAVGSKIAINRNNNASLVSPVFRVRLAAAA